LASEGKKVLLFVLKHSITSSQKKSYIKQSSMSVQKTF